MKLLKNYKLYLTLLALVTLALVLIFNKYLVYGLVFAGVAFVIYLVWRLFLKRTEDELSRLGDRLEQAEKQNSALMAENEELRSRRLNIAEIRNKLDLGLMEVNTNFTRTWNDKFTHGAKSVHFIGALQVKVLARYGIDLNEIRIKQDPETNTVIIANVKPKFLSFNDLDYEWKIAEIMEYKQPWFGANHWRKSTALQELGGQIKEELRAKTHQEVINGCEELDWIIGPLKKQVTGVLELLFSAPGRTVKMVDAFDDTFRTLPEKGDA